VPEDGSYERKRCELGVVIAVAVARGVAWPGCVIAGSIAVTRGIPITVVIAVVPRLLCGDGAAVRRCPFVFCYVGPCNSGRARDAELPPALFSRHCALASTDSSDRAPVLGQGNISCSLWLEGRQTDSPGSASRTAWILGFISAFNQYGLQSQGADVSEGKNTDELMGWIDNYCRQHQGDDLHTASEAFIDDFRQRNRR
jgi:hypothetical protein